MVLLATLGCGSGAPDLDIEPYDGPCTAPDWPSVVDFGRVQPGSRPEQRLPLSSFSCPIKAIRLLPAAQHLFYAEQEWDAITVGFASERTLAQSGSLEVDFHGAPTTTVRLIADGFPQRVLLLPETIDFGELIARCQARRRSAVLFNLSDETIRWIRPPTSEDSVFSTSGQPKDWPQLIPPGGQVTTLVGFHPQETRSYGSRVHFDLEFDGVPHTLTLRTLGRAVESPRQRDRFEVPVRPQVDILLVVDATERMSTWQNNLRLNLEAYIQYREAQGYDYRVAVTTTSLAGPVFLQRPNGETLITPSSAPSPGELLWELVGQAADAGPSEGLAAARRALTTTASTGFVRANAELSVVFISSGADASDDSVDSYASSFFKVKGPSNTHLFSASAIVGPDPDGCVGAGGRASPAPRYARIAKGSGGIVQAICAGDWSRTLEFPSNGWPRPEYILSHQPVEDTLSVSVNDRDFPRVLPDGTPQWTYDFPSNSIRFAPGRPEPGSRIEVTYVAECL